MRKALTALLLFMGVFLAATSASAQYTLDFTLVNRTGYTISEVYVAPTSSDDWEEDVLGRDVFEDGEQVLITFPKKTKTCKWDLLVIYDDEEEASWTDFDLCTVSTIVLRYDRKKNTTWAEYE